MSARSGRTGILLVNLGTPDAPETGPVRRYLREFLSDPRVIDLSALGRALLLNLVILPTRPAKSAAAYRLIWTDAGSPLLVHSLALRDRLRTHLGETFEVELGMRYGQPSIASALETLAKSRVDRIVVAPLFPQYSSAATGSAVEEAFRVAGTLWNVPPLSVTPPFYDDEGFIAAFAAVGRPGLAELKPDHVLFSFHGLPERQILKSDDTASHCLATAGCCERMSDSNRFCYRAQCFATARLLAAKLGLGDGAWSVSFQSRLGRTPWIRPYSDVVIPELAKNGSRRMLVFCPAFVADCLETLEEVGMRLREQFLAAGGEQLQLVPSLNATDAWVEAVGALVRRA